MQPHSLRRSSWEWIQQQPDFKSHELAAVLGKDIKTTTQVIAHFVKKGCVRIVDNLKRPHTYQRVEGVKPNFRDATTLDGVSSRQKIWQAIRFIKTFTVSDIESASEERQNTIQSYISYLKASGYVKIEHKKGVTKYRLIENTGRLCPIARYNGLFDQNTQTFTPKIGGKQ